MAPFWQGLEAEVRNDGNLWISVNAWTLLLFASLVLLYRQSCFTKALFKVAKSCSPAILVVIAYLCRNMINVPTPRSGLPITSQHYVIDDGQLRDSRQHWFVGQRRTREVEAIYVSADELASSVVPSAQDEDLDKFLFDCKRSTETWFGRIRLLIKQNVFFALQRFRGWSRTDASGFVDMATMYVVSVGQLQHLFEQASNRTAGQRIKPGWKPKAILDVGAGKGQVTEILAKSFALTSEQVCALEVSAPLRSSLAARGYFVAADFAEVASLPEFDTFEMVALLNVLDRCDEPLSLIRGALDKLHNDGVLLVAIVLPFCSFVHEGRKGLKWGQTGKRPPRAPLQIHPAAKCKASASFELAAAAFVAKAFQPMELEVLAWTRLPYLSSADTKFTHFYIDMALFALKRRNAVEANRDVAKSAHAQGIAASTRITTEAESTSPNNIPAQCSARPTSPIYTWLSSLLDGIGVRSYGDVLDAGTGVGSLCWLLHQQYQTITGVTAVSSGKYGHKRLEDVISSANASVSIVLDNWRNDSLLSGREFDVVVADYLLGAVELHWPYGAYDILDRVFKRVKLGGYVLIVGLEPYEMVLDAKTNRQDEVVLEIEALGDAAALLAGHSTIRELPEQVVKRLLGRFGGFEIVATRHFSAKLHGEHFIKSQLDFAHREAQHLKNRGLRLAFEERVSQLRVQESVFGVHDRAHNYAIVVRKNQDKEEGEDEDDDEADEEEDDDDEVDEDESKGDGDVEREVDIREKDATTQELERVIEELVGVDEDASDAVLAAIARRLRANRLRRS